MGMTGGHMQVKSQNRRLLNGKQKQHVRDDRKASRLFALSIILREEMCIIIMNSGSNCTLTPDQCQLKSHIHSEF
eukprot:scaffold984_cov144-Skeletonema_marinoi.AAC.12